MSPNSSYTFKSLVKFCAREKIGPECVAAALAVVLMLPQNTAEISLPPLSAVPKSNIFSNAKLSKCFGSYREEYYDEMFKCLNQCITMSCTLEGIESLLCSAVVESSIPRNLVGAHLSSIAEAVQPL